MRQVLEILLTIGIGCRSRRTCGRLATVSQGEKRACKEGAKEDSQEHHGGSAEDEYTSSFHKFILLSFYCIDLYISYLYLTQLPCDTSSIPRRNEEIVR